MTHCCEAPVIHTCCDDPTSDHEHSKNALLVKIIISACSFAVLMLGMLFSIEALHQPILQSLIALPAFIIGCQHFGFSAIKSIRRLSPNMDVLIFIGVFTSYICSIIAIIGNFPHEYIFFEACVSIVTFVLIGYWIEEQAIIKTTSAIADLSKLQFLRAKRFTQSGEIEEIDSTSIQLEDILVANRGDKIATDGEIIEGSGLIDESIITGESQGIEAQVGRKVTGGTQLLNGSIKFKATAIGSETILAGIVRLVNEATTRKPSIQRIGDQVSSWFVPIIICLSIVFFFFNLIVFQCTLPEAMMRAFAVLAISCPCAMGLATPTAVMVALGRAAKNGILIRGGDTLERLSETKKIFFDKTGTLTTKTEGSEILRPGTKDLISYFEQKKIECAIVSGDKQEKVKAIADQVGIKNIYSEQKPDQKLNLVKTAQSEGTLAFVGDGVNDAPALQLATVGIALGSGTDIAMNAAQVVLLGDKISLLKDAHKLSKATTKTIKENLWWAFLYNFIAVPLAALGFFTPLAAALLMTMSDVIVIGNSLRLRYKKI